MRQIVITGLAFWSLCCGRSTEPIVDYYSRESQEQRLVSMRGAPIIIVGTVNRVRMIGGAKPAVRAPHLSLQLYTATVEVEMVVRGNVDTTLQFFFFGPDPKDGLLGLPKFYIRPHERRLFFLKLENGRYRAVGDYLDYSEPVYSGKPDFRRAPDDDTDRAIARILLTPSRQLQDVAMFAATLFNSAGRARSLTSLGFVQDLIEDLATHPNPEVRRQACLNLTVHHKLSSVCAAQ